METKTQHGYLVLADISGYTSYLAGTELEHAQEILTELLETIVDHFKSMLTISKLEGDAVFGYVADAKAPRGETLLELIEGTYVAFRDRVEAVRRRTTCQCNACRAIPTLDLKFMLHYGDYIRQQVSGINELVGSDVNLVHRLLKNHIGEATGWRAYALFTEAGLAHLGVRPEGMHEQPETYEHLGEVKTFSLNMQARYQELVEARRVFVPPEEADVVFTYDFAAPPPMVWTWLNDPQKRVLWDGNDAVVPVLRPGGRTGPGARNHCMHGKNVTNVETILDWRPFGYWTQETSSGPMLITWKFESTPDGGGTRMSVYVRGKMRLPKPLVRPLLNFMMKKVYDIRKLFDKMARLMAEEMAREQAAEAAPAS
ncbi:MAG TPA: DUF2652 domain-containing protein [Anaerolineales bacterium]|nr:DUF2652 domain-containing protein [Anaerolineales bacterium]